MRDFLETVPVCRCGQANVSTDATCVYCGRKGQIVVRRLPPQPHTPEWDAWRTQQRRIRLLMDDEGLLS